MGINRPTLPPKRGYVEVERDGKRVYMNAETGEIFGKESVLSLEALRQSIPEIKDALCEQDTAVERRLAAIEDALCELDGANRTITKGESLS